MCLGKQDVSLPQKTYLGLEMREEDQIMWGVKSPL